MYTFITLVDQLKSFVCCAALVELKQSVGAEMLVHSCHVDFGWTIDCLRSLRCSRGYVGLFFDEGARDDDYEDNARSMHSVRFFASNMCVRSGHNNPKHSCEQDTRNPRAHARSTHRDAHMHIWAPVSCAHADLGPSVSCARACLMQKRPAEHNATIIIYPLISLEQNKNTKRLRR